MPDSDFFIERDYPLQPQHVPLREQQQQQKTPQPGLDKLGSQPGRGCEEDATLALRLPIPADPHEPIGEV